MKGLLKNKKGMTLTEIIVGSLLFALVVLTVSAVISPMMLAFRRANDLAEYNMILDNVGNILASDIAQAQEIPDALFSDNNLTLIINGDTVVYSIVGIDGETPATEDDGYLYKTVNDEGGLVFPIDFYNRKTVSFERVDGLVEPDFAISVTVFSGGGLAQLGADLSRTYAARPLMMIG